MLKKNLSIIFIIFLILVGGYYLYINKFKDDTQQSEQQKIMDKCTKLCTENRELPTLDCLDDCYFEMKEDEVPYDENYVCPKNYNLKTEEDVYNWVINKQKCSEREGIFGHNCIRPTIRPGVDGVGWDVACRNDRQCLVEIHVNFEGKIDRLPMETCAW